jgi:hypothetical protein
MKQRLSRQPHEGRDMDGQGNGLEWRRPGASSQAGVTGTCGAKTRDGTPCAHPAGWGTDHPGVGRCKLHGGSTSRPMLCPSSPRTKRMEKLCARSHLSALLSAERPPLTPLTLRTAKAHPGLSCPLNLLRPWHARPPKRQPVSRPPGHGLLPAALARRRRCCDARRGMPRPVFFPPTRNLGRRSA